MTCDQLRLSLGTYVLDALEPAERAEVDAHLLDCPSCAVELSELETLPPILDQLRPGDIARLVGDGTVVVPLDPRRSGPRRHRRLLAAAAAVVVIGVAGTVTLSVTHHETSSFQATAHGITMAVTVTPGGSGSRLAVSVTGLPQHEQCQLVAVSSSGSRASAGTWTASYDGTATVHETTSILPADLTGFVLIGTDGRQLVNITT